MQIYFKHMHFTQNQKCSRYWQTLWRHADHQIASALSKSSCTCRNCTRQSSVMRFVSSCSSSCPCRVRESPLLGGPVVPLSCCSRAVITVTASCTIMRRVIGWLEPVWPAIICPSSLIASFMSLTRNLLQRTHTVSRRFNRMAQHIETNIKLCKQTHPQLIKTRSSAIAERPCDASCCRVFSLVAKGCSD